MTSLRVYQVRSVWISPRELPHEGLWLEQQRLIRLEVDSSRV